MGGCTPEEVDGEERLCSQDTGTFSEPGLSPAFPVIGMARLFHVIGSCDRRCSGYYRLEVAGFQATGLV